MVRRKLKKKEIFMSLFALIFVILVVTFYIWHQVESVRLGYEINRQEAQIAALKKEVKHLEVSKSNLLSLDRVEQISKQELGLRAARDDQIIRRSSPAKDRKQTPWGRQ
ncbi:MAG: cell division protein FtsL [Candidatus Aminicenantes bacterium]|nr:cell division protein FtsL [Candidatus Aminicenantes bacterium]